MLKHEYIPIVEIRQITKYDETLRDLTCAKFEINTIKLTDNYDLPKTKIDHF